MNNYIVRAKCGHLGMGRFIPISFPVRANSSKEAASIGKNLPRVKKGRKDSIINVVEVSWFAYQVQRILNEMDPYLQVHCKQEQDEIMHLIEHRIEYEDEKPSIQNKRRDSVKYKLLKNAIRCADMDFQIKQYC